MIKNGTNVSGQINKKSLALIKGQNVKTHDIIKMQKGISFQDKAYKWGASTKAGAQKVYGNIAKGYSKYGGPTTKLFQKTGSAALGVGKFALKRGALGFPGLIAGAGYYGAKAIGKKIVSRQKGLEFSPYRQYNKKGRKII